MKELNTMIFYKAMIYWRKKLLKKINKNKESLLKKIEGMNVKENRTVTHLFVITVFYFNKKQKTFVKKYWNEITKNV